MSISTTGFINYKYQHLVSVLIGLYYGDKLKSFVVEPTGGEDAEFLVEGADGSLRKIELQVKGENGPIDEAKLGGWLGKFPANRSDSCLLERIFQNEERRAIFVLKARCTDMLAGLVVPLRSNPVHEHKSIPLRPEQSAALLRSFEGELKNNESDPEKDRFDNRRTVVKCIGLRRSWLRRLVLVDSLTNERAWELLETTLTKKFKVPVHYAKTAAESVIRIVEGYLGQQVSLVPAVRDCLMDFAGDRIFSSPVHCAPAECDLVRRIEQDSALLITGPSKCGKTHIARWLCKMNQEEGVHCKEFGMVRDAYRFLVSENFVETRLALLDDPFGSVELRADAKNEFHRFQELVSQLGGHRRIIVTSRDDILTELLTKVEILNERVSRSQWTNMGDVSHEYRRSIALSWAKHYLGTETLPERVVMCLDEAVNSGQSVGDIGRLAARLAKENMIGDGIESSQSLVRRLSDQREMGCLLYALAVTSSHATPVMENTLGFVLDGKEGRPGRWSVDGLLGYTLGQESESDSPRLPEYDQIYLISDITRGALDTLLDEGMIERYGERGYRFMHPEFARAALDVHSLTVTERRSILERAIFSLDRTNSLRAVTVLGETPGFNDEKFFVELFLNALYSVFPSTSDRALEGLIRSIGADELSSDEPVFDELNKYLSRRPRVLWYPEGAVFDRRKIVSLMSILENRPEAEPINFEMFKDSDDALLRANAYRNAIERASENCHELVHDAIKDENPLVVLAVIEGVGRAAVKGTRIPAEVERSLAQGIGNSTFLACLVASRIFDFKNFLRHHVVEELPWSLWARLAVKVLSLIPACRSQPMDKMYVCAKHAVNHVSGDVITPFLKEWIRWIERRCRYQLPNESALSVVQLVLLASRSEPHCRTRVYGRLLEQPDTGVQCCFVADLVDSWIELSDVEQRELLDLLCGNRQDVMWLQAIALTRKVVPSRIEEALLGDGCFLSRNPEYLLENLPEALLRACLSVYRGTPQPLWWIGKHHALASPWSDILILAAKDPDSHCFLIAIDDGLWMGEPTEAFSVVWEELCRTARSCVLDKLFRSLLSHSVEYNGADFEVLWRHLLEGVQASSSRQRWLCEVGECIEALEDSNNLQCIIRALDGHDAVQRWWHSDNVLLAALRDDRCDDEIFDVVRRFPPRLSRSISALRQRFSGTDWFGDVVRERHRKIDEQKRRFSESPSEPRDWSSLTC